MAKKPATRRRGELPVEQRVRKLRAELEEQMLRAAKKQLKSQLSTYAAAKVDRKTRDWKSPVGSADLAIIDDSLRMNARARQLVRDSWIAKAIVRAKSRNIVGNGIVPVPTAHIDGVEQTEFNATVEELFLDWASDRKSCDVEGRRTFWQMQSLAIEERCTVGEFFIVWSYQRKPNTVGLQLQCFEVEQLDSDIQQCGNNEVRKGIEVDHLGRAVAYHFYERPQNDYLSTTTQSIRIPADRVIHYFRADRSQQTHGVSELAPVMMDIRDFSAFKDATLFRARMEACIGFAITKNVPTSTTAPAGVYPGAGESNTVTGGQRAFDMTPGMVAELMPGEQLNPFIPSSPGNNYSPFTEVSLRGIGAGVGLSYGAIGRKSDSNYSGARQDMLEDERELGPEQDMLVDIMIQTVYGLFVELAVAEGKLSITIEEFSTNRRQYLDAEYVPPPRAWIDPQAEALAAEKMLELDLVTRKELRAKLGGRFQRTIQQRADEKKQAQALGITFAEDKEEKAQQAEQTAARAANMRAKLKVIEPPGYRESASDVIRCSTCRWFKPCEPGTRGVDSCMAFNAVADAACVCNDWEAPPAVEAVTTNPKVQPPGPMEGEKPFDEQSARDQA